MQDVHSWTSIHDDKPIPEFLNVNEYSDNSIPKAENFVAVFDMLLKFHNLSVKFVCNFNEKIIH